MLFVALQLSAQDQPSMITFSEQTFDFGTIAEEDGPVSHTFYFKNEGTAPIVVNSVKASCGCTTPSWTQEPVAPGDTGIVVAEYNPYNRPGAFSKTISVITNTEPNLAVLHIKGMVRPKPKTPAEDYPTQMGRIRTQYRSFNMGKVTTKEPVTKAFDVYNDSDEPVIFSSNTVNPSYIAVETQPQELLPQQKGSIYITYHPQARNSLGFASDQIRLFTNEAEDSVKEFNVMATIEEYFPPMTSEELEHTPRLSVDKKSYDFGEVKAGTSVKTDFVITNIGKSELNIRDTKANCGCTLSQPAKKTLLPGESTNISVTFNSTGRRGKQHKTVTVFSNDPTNPTQQLVLTGRVDAGDGE